MSVKAEEINFDGLVGPTHHYGGYALGNLASMQHKQQISHPKKAALQGLNKMKLLADLGIPQAVLPPRMRPNFTVLRALGFRGDEAQIFEKVAHESPSLFYTLSSSSSMWAANSATISPSADTRDGRVHFTVANLQSHFHRAIESEETYHLLRYLFADESLFAIHPPLPKGGDFGDEGAANHTRFCRDYAEGGVHLFVYGKSAFEVQAHRFPFRQAKEASEAVARQHGLDPATTLFVQQNPEAIKAGVFHNDVISVGNRNRFFYHEHAFINTAHVIDTIHALCPLKTLCVTEEMLSLKEAVKTYLFNGQLVTLPNGEDHLLAPHEASSLNLTWLPFGVTFVDLRESMRNGGGPACLRFRCVLTPDEKKRVHPPILWSATLYQRLVEWIETYYRDQLSLADLHDPSLLQENLEALDALTHILHLGSFYEFQREVNHSP
jgi:succinylarginine dihydrolase